MSKGEAPAGGHSMGTADTQAFERSGPEKRARDSITSARSSQKRPGALGPALPRRLVSLAEASKYLAVSDWSVRAMVWRGDLPHVRRGKRILLDLKDLDGWIEREKVRGA